MSAKTTKISISDLTDALIKAHVTPEALAAKVGSSASAVSRWKAGKSLPRSEQEHKLRVLGAQLGLNDLFFEPSNELTNDARKQVESLTYSFLNEFREIVHRFCQFPHRNDGLDFLARVFLAHISSKERGEAGISSDLNARNGGAATSLSAFILASLKVSLSSELYRELIDSSSLIKGNQLSDKFAEAIITLFNEHAFAKTIEQIIGIHQLDILNDIFGRFLTDSFSEEKEFGQYLTPPEVVELMVEMGFSSLPQSITKDFLSEKGQLSILDPSCGVASFLVSAAKKLRVFNKGGKHQSLVSFFENRLVGIDLSRRMLQLAATNMAILEGGQIQLFYQNALDRKGVNHADEKLVGRTGLILTNPPFGSSFSQGEIGEYEIFKKGAGSSSRLDSELLFFERYIEWLAPGGVLVAIVPDSLLTNQGAFQSMREYILAHCEILSVISLPPVTFAAAGTTTKTSILHVRKRQKSTAVKSQTFFGVCEHVGYEVSTRGSQRRRIYTGRNDIKDLLNDFLLKKTSPLLFQGAVDSSTERWDATYHKLAAATAKLHQKPAVSDFAELIDDRVDPRRRAVSEFEYIEISDVEPRFGLVSSKSISISEAPSRARKMVKAGDILVSTVRPERGAIAVVPKELDGAICSSGFAVLRAQSIHPYVLATLLKSEDVIVQMQRHMSGIAYPAINENIIPKLKLPLSVDDIEKYNKLGKLYEQTIQKLYEGRSELKKAISG